jgi:hypothetical protein
MQIKAESQIRCVGSPSFAWVELHMAHWRIRSALAQLTFRPKGREEPCPTALPSPTQERVIYWQRRAEETCFPELREAYRRVARSYLGGALD